MNTPESQQPSPLSVRFSPDEREIVEAAAHFSGVSVSHLVRHAITTAALEKALDIADMHPHDPARCGNIGNGIIQAAAVALRESDFGVPPSAQQEEFFGGLANKFETSLAFAAELEAARQAGTLYR
jgi:hypothetical protein